MSSLAAVKAKLNAAGLPNADAVVGRFTLEMSNAQPAAVGALYVGGNKIAAYPMLAQMEDWRSVRQLCQAVGCALWSGLPKFGKDRWKMKLVSATEAETSQFYAACGAAASWKDAVSSIAQAVPRLVAIHISNALIANRVPFSQACRNEAHPCTESLRSGAARYSLIPLLSAYAPQLINYVPPDQVCMDGSDFSAFFTEYAHGFECIGESSVRATMKRLVESVIACEAN